MKKTVIIARIIFWTAFLTFMTTLCFREAILKEYSLKFAKDVSSMLNHVDINAPAEASLDFKPVLMYILWASGFLMYIGFIMLESATVIKPKIKSGRIYKLKAAMSHDKGKKQTVVLSYDDQIETFHCNSLIAAETPTIGENYIVEKLNNNLLLTAAN